MIDTEIMWSCTAGLFVYEVLKLGAAFAYVLIKDFFS